MRTIHRRSQRRYGSAALVCAIAVLSAYALLPREAMAQGVRGAVLEEESRRAVAAAMVVLVDTAGNVAGQALSDSAGLFFVEVDPGTYSVVVNRLGYDPLYVTKVTLADPSIVPLEIELSPDAIALPGLVVEAEPKERYLRRIGFYERRDLGFGHHIVVDEDRRLQAVRPSDFVRRFPGIRITGGQVYSQRLAWIEGTHESCVLQVVVDGIHRGINMDRVLKVHEVDAIEVYYGLSNYPAQWNHLALNSYRGMRRTISPSRDIAGEVKGKLYRTCGVVVVWTRH